MRHIHLFKIFLIQSTAGFPVIRQLFARLRSPMLSRGISTTSSDFLEIKNAHPLDDSIRFNEQCHTYEVNGQPAAYSVTTAISRFFTPFNADAAIASMMAKKDWPRPEYIVSAIAFASFLLQLMSIAPWCTVDRVPMARLSAPMK